MTMSIEAAAQALREATRETGGVFDLVSRSRRPDGYRRNRRIALPFCIVGRPGSFSRLDFDHERYRSRYEPDDFKTCQTSGFNWCRLSCQ